MNKIVLSVILVVIVLVGGFLAYKNISEQKPNLDNKINTVDIEKNENENIESKDNNNLENSKILVAYFSAQNHTKTIAEKIANNLNADIFEIEPENIYTEEDLDWTNNNSRVSKEHNDETLRIMKLKNSKVDNWEEYDTVLIGYPIWWGIAAWPVDTFVKDNDFDGKVVIPFCTSASSSLGNSGKLLEDLAGTGTWQEGHRFSSSASEADIKEWTDSIK